MTEEFDPLEAVALMQEAHSEWLQKESRTLAALRLVLEEKGIITADEVDRAREAITAVQETRLMVEAAFDPKLEQGFRLVRKFRKLQEYLKQGLTHDEAMRRVNEEFGEEE